MCVIVQTRTVWLYSTSTLNAIAMLYRTFEGLLKASGKLSRGMVLLQYSTQTAKASKHNLRAFHFKVLNHPPHSLDPSPCDNHVFDRLKKVSASAAIKRRDAVEEWFHQRHS
ncbi:hypothetical protein AVEN_36263-1 [Araneus ventricosus]|uniref:Uncharacterized protein n=1 Tax=Araneus ventricosus TaxID=182803 RepID=A0A4Y2NZ37_ARAVE|nr:hypothetical protein AVEN_36263-1 [Araneus ventricosus]